MEENKYICPECGSEMNAFYDKPALNLTCPKCGCKITTTKWDEIYLDDKKYKIKLTPINKPTIEQIKTISKLSGANFIESKSMLINGSLVFEGFAIEVLEKKKDLECYDIPFSINPLFKY